MDIWQIFIAIYGLSISPFSGICLVKWRMKGGLKTGKYLFLYLLIGFFNMGVTLFTLFILPEGYELLSVWAYLILFLYVVTYGVHPLTIDTIK